MNERRVACLMGKGDCPENCPAHYPNKRLSDQIKIKSGIDISTLPPRELLTTVGKYLSVFSLTMLTTYCLKKDAEVTVKPRRRSG